MYIIDSKSHESSFCGPETEFTPFEIENSITHNPIIFDILKQIESQIDFVSQTFSIHESSGGIGIELDHISVSCNNITIINFGNYHITSDSISGSSISNSSIENNSCDSTSTSWGQSGNTYNPFFSHFKQYIKSLYSKNIKSKTELIEDIDNYLEDAVQTFSFTVTDFPNYALVCNGKLIATLNSKFYESLKGETFVNPAVSHFISYVKKIKYSFTVEF